MMQNHVIPTSLSEIKAKKRIRRSRLLFNIIKCISKSKTEEFDRDRGS
jgi:hypothetical protein